MNATEEMTLVLPCPNCGENLLENGFYNYCTETTALREDNNTLLRGGRVYMDHDENDHETTDHECALQAYCKECETLLPWPLYEIRALDGAMFDEAEKLIAKLIMQASAEADSEDAEEPPTTA